MHVDSQVAQSQNVVAVESDGETVLLNIDKGSYYSLAESALAIWQGLSAPIQAKALIANLETTHDCGSGGCADDVLEFLTELRDEGLIEVKAAAG